MSISVVISTHNRSKSLQRCLHSVSSFADEIIVVDSGSTDDTVSVAKSVTQNVYSRPNNVMLNVNKNYGFSKATKEWILNLDDDEAVTPELAREIKAIVKSQSSSVVGYWISRKNIIFGKWIRHGLWWPDRQLRLFRRGKGRFAEKHVHEYISVVGETGILSAPFMHYNYDSINQYLYKMQNIYIENEVKKYVSSGYSVRWSDAIRFPVSDFLKIYFAQSGYKDGLHGLVLAILQAFYSFLVFAKLWELNKFSEQTVTISEVSDEFHQRIREGSYWLRTAHMHETRNPFSGAWHRFMRKIGAVI